MPNSAVRNWLLIIWNMVFAIVLVGGITRLTGSGLSMVDWHPLMGILPPLDDATWQATFAKYQQSPQFLKVNDWMQLADFKRIFFWEYTHRLLGRGIGLIFFVPWVYFVVRKQLTGRWVLQTAVAFILGGLQGLLGWYMVKSGLVDHPEVSHYRLAAHLSLALLCGMYVLWLALSLIPEKKRPPPSKNSLRRGTWAFMALLALQILYGAFMAGTRAGYMYTSFPTMNGEWIPSGLWVLEPAWLNLFEGHIAIHFIHRTLGWLVGFAGLGLAIWGIKRADTPRRRWAAALVGSLVLLQFGLGVLTVMGGVAVPIAAAHQGCAYLLLSATVFLAHAWRLKESDNG